MDIIYDSSNWVNRSSKFITASKVQWVHSVAPKKFIGNINKYRVDPNS